MFAMTFLLLLPFIYAWSLPHVYIHTFQKQSSENSISFLKISHIFIIFWIGSRTCILWHFSLLNRLYFRAVFGSQQNWAESLEYPYTPHLHNHISFLLLQFFFSFSESHIIGILQYEEFSDWLLPLSNTYLSFLLFFSLLDSSFLLVLNNIPLSGCTVVYLFTYWRASWLLPSFDSYEVAINVCVQVFVWP